MKNKKTLKMLLTLCAAFLLMGGFSVTAYAQVPEGADDATDDIKLSPFLTYRRPRGGSFPAFPQTS